MATALRHDRRPFLLESCWVESPGHVVLRGIPDDVVNWVVVLCVGAASCLCVIL
jgi:hypothetical protein